MTEIKVGNNFTTTTRRGFDTMGVNGEAVGYINRKLVFIAGALPGERVTAKITEVLDNYLRAEVTDVLKPNPNRVSPKDVYANEVGGFELENMNYPAQLRFKKALVKEALDQAQPSGYQHYNVHKTMGMTKPYGYRNKLQFPIRRNADGKIIAGLFKTRSHELVNLPTCSVQDPETMHVLKMLVQIFTDLDYPIYNEANNSGILKTIIVRAATNTKDVQIILVTHTPKLIKKRQILAAIRANLPEVNSVMQNVNPDDTPLIWGDKTIKLMGTSHITEKINRMSFQLSARSFLQLNTKMIPQLYEVVKHALNLQHADRLLDAYSGVGTMGLPLARNVRSLRGMDTIPEAIDNANANAHANHIKNAKYYVGKAEDLLPQWIEAGWTPDAVIVDPPRVGLDENFIKALLSIHPAKFVYVSCNPASLARDLEKLTQKYEVNWLQPIDMMPQTARVEVVASFTLRKPKPKHSFKRGRRYGKRPFRKGYDHNHGNHNYHSRNQHGFHKFGQHRNHRSPHRAPHVGIWHR